MDRLGRLFWNSRQHRLRAGWRIIIHLLLWLFVPALLAGIVGAPLSELIQRVFPALAPIAGRAANFTLTLLGALLGTWIATRYLDKRPFVDLGFRFDRHWWPDFGFGLALGAFLMAGVFVVELLFGWITVTGSFFADGEGRFAVAILGPLIVFIVVGITEEVLARGYEIRNMAEGFNTRSLSKRQSVLLAWLVSSSLFGMLHVFNPNATWYSTANLMLAGLFLGVGYILTGSLAISIGLHITWNFFQGNVFGFPVSGNDFASATFIAVTQGGPPLWTGGAFGPEAGLIGIVAVVIGSLLTVWWVRQRYGAVRVQESLSIYRRIS